MAASFFFYDLETTGIDPRAGRVMQFAGIRTDMELKPVGEPVNVLVKLTPDVLPSPDAIFITGITPQQTLAEGLTEAGFLKLFYERVVQPDTIFMGFNSVRFDDEFMRFLHWRNFYDPYEWQWQNGCSRWDLLDVVRMTRALRPEGINWPFGPDGKPANRLEFLTTANKLDHEQAHDALSDVYATIAVAKLIRDTQPDLFGYLLAMRDKKNVAGLVLKREPIVYATGKYDKARLCTSVVVALTETTLHDGALVYNLREDPTPFLDMTVDELVEAWRYQKDPEAIRLPVKTLKFNRCPAIAPLGVIKDEATQDRIDLTLGTIQKHWAILKSRQAEFTDKVQHVVKRLDDERELARTPKPPHDEHTVDTRLYEGFVGTGDKQTMRAIRAAAPVDVSGLQDQLQDERLRSLLPLYKARNYPKALNGEERAAWDAFCRDELFAGGQSSKLAKYFARLGELAEGEVTPGQQYLLEELQLYGQSLIPADASE